MDTNEIKRLAHLAAHEAAIIAVNNHVEWKQRYATNETIEETYKIAYDSMFALVEKKLNE